MNTYTLVYTSTPRNLAPAAQAALMKSLAPLDGFLGPWAVAGLTFVSDTTGVANVVQATRTIVLQDSPTPGAIPPGQSMKEILTNAVTGAIATGIRAPVVAAPVAVT